MTLADLLAATYADLGYDASPSSSVATRLTRYLNEGYRTILSMSEFGPLRSNTLTFSSVNGQKFYGFPQALQTIDAITDTTNAIRLRLITQSDLRTLDPQEISTGTPTYYSPWGQAPTQISPASTGVWVASSASGDTTQTAAVIGVRAGGIPAKQQTGALAGITRVQVGTFTDYVVIQQFELSAVAVGLVTLYDAATAGNVLGQIAIGDHSVKYQTIRLWPTPSAVLAYNVDGVLNLAELAQTYDVPLIPGDFQYVLLDFARMREYEYRDDERFKVASMAYAQKLKLFRDRVTTPPDYRPVCGRLNDRGSSLGPWFPSGRW